jgi:hypothetical protein
MKAGALTFCRKFCFESNQCLETIFIVSLEISWRKSSKVQKFLKKSKIEKLDIGNYRKQGS